MCCEERREGLSDSKFIIQQSFKVLFFEKTTNDVLVSIKNDFTKKLLREVYKWQSKRKFCQWNSKFNVNMNLFNYVIKLFTMTYRQHESPLFYYLISSINFKLLSNFNNICNGFKYKWSNTDEEENKKLLLLTINVTDLSLKVPAV